MVTMRTFLLLMQDACVNWDEVLTLEHRLLECVLYSDIRELWSWGIRIVFDFISVNLLKAIGSNE